MRIGILLIMILVCGCARGSKPNDDASRGEINRDTKTTLVDSVRSGSLDHQGGSDNSGVVLSPGEVASDTASGLSGDPDAAWRLYVHFSVGLDQQDLASKWARIASENGSREGMVVYARELFSDTKNREGCRRAKFWIERAKALDLAMAAKHVAADTGRVVEKSNSEVEWRATCSAGNQGPHTDLGKDP